MVHVALTKMSINQFKPVQQIRQQALEHTELIYLLLGQYTSEKILNIQWPTFLQLLIFGSSFCLGSKINYKCYKHMVNYCTIPSILHSFNFFKIYYVMKKDDIFFSLLYTLGLYIASLQAEVLKKYFVIYLSKKIPKDL